MSSQNTAVQDLQWSWISAKGFQKAFPGVAWYKTVPRVYLEIRTQLQWSWEMGCGHKPPEQLRFIRYLIFKRTLAIVCSAVFRCCCFPLIRTWSYVTHSLGSCVFKLVHFYWKKLGLLLINMTQTEQCVIHHSTKRCQSYWPLSREWEPLGLSMCHVVCPRFLGNLPVTTFPEEEAIFEHSG